MSFYKDQLKEYLSDKEVSGLRALSVGNMNDDRKYFKKAEFGEWLTIDINAEYKPDIVADLNFDISTHQLSALERERIKDGFDAVFAFELFEYLWNPYQCFVNFNKLTKQGGHLWISCPFIYPTHNPEDQDYMRVTEWGIKKLLAETGFEIEDFQYRYWRDANGYLQSVAFDGMRPAKNYPHHDITGFLIKAKKL